MNLLFPAKLPVNDFDFEAKKTVDSFWEKESQIAKQHFNLSYLSGTHGWTPLSIFSEASVKEFLYRGWIVKPQVYKELTTDFGIKTYNSYSHYMWSYDFPNWYKNLEKFTPYSLIIEADEILSHGLENVAKIAAFGFGSRPVMIKDYLKSRKHEWYDACFIENVSDITETIRVMSNFFKLQGRDFYGGLVFREFLNLKKVGIHPKTKMPLPLEFRTFFIKGKPIFTTPYWSNDALYPEHIQYPPNNWLELIGKEIKSPFVALDIAQDENDKWWVIEVNDGGSAGLPDHVDMEDFYYKLFENL